MKRIFCFCLFSVLILAALVGCESQGPTGTSQPTAAPTTSAPVSASSPTATETSIPNSAAAQPLTQVATQYYNAIKARNYAQAYTYLDANATNADGQQLTLSSFEQMAQTVDSQEGPVTDFTLAAYPPMVVMTISRPQLAAYHAHLQMKQEGQTWKITSIDRI